MWYLFIPVFNCFGQLIGLAQGATDPILSIESPENYWAQLDPRPRMMERSVVISYQFMNLSAGVPYDKVGSGVLVSGKRLYTAHHVTDPDPQDFEKNESNITYKVKIHPHGTPEDVIAVEAVTLRRYGNIRDFSEMMITEESINRLPASKKHWLQSLPELQEGNPYVDDETDVFYIGTLAEEISYSVYLSRLLDRYEGYSLQDGFYSFRYGVFTPLYRDRGATGTLEDRLCGSGMSGGGLFMPDGKIIAVLSGGIEYVGLERITRLPPYARCVWAPVKLP